MIARNAKGHYLPGTSGNPSGRPAGTASLANAARRYFADPPSEFFYNLAAGRAGLERCLVPEFERLVDLVAWVTIVASFDSIERLREVLDRIDPKPNRLAEAAAVLRRPVSPGAPANEEVAAGQTFYEELEGGLSRDSEEPLH